MGDNFFYNLAHKIAREIQLQKSSTNVAYNNNKKEYQHNLGPCRPIHQWLEEIKAR